MVTRNVVRHHLSKPVRYSIIKRVGTQAQTAVMIEPELALQRLARARQLKQARLARLDDRRADDRQVAAIDRELARAGERARAAYATEHQWADRVRAGLAALLDYFEEKPHLAKMWVLHPAAEDPGVRLRREETLARLEHVVDEGRDDARRQPPPRTAEAVVAGTLGAIHARLLEREQPTFSDLLNPLMSFIVLPYLGAGAARSEMSRPAAVYLRT
jgi:hypothetical protein